MKPLKPRTKREKQLVAQTQIAAAFVDFERGKMHGAQQERKKIESENAQQKFRTLIGLVEKQIEMQSNFGQTIAQLVDLASRL